MKKILFYSDTEDFGGHEIMSVKIANYLSSLKKYEVEFLYRNKSFLGCHQKRDLIGYSKTHLKLSVDLNFDRL